MKKRFLSLLVVAAAMTGSFSAAAQTVFAPLGAEWWYEWRGPFIPLTHTHVRVVGDSTVGGYPTRKLLVEELYDAGTGYQVQTTARWLVRTAGEEVFRWNATTSTYDLKLSFSRPIGAIWNFVGCTPSSVLALVLDSVQQVAVGGVPLRQQFYGSSPPSGYRTVLERVGVDGAILFLEPSCGPGPSSPAAPYFLSYFDSTLQIGTPPPLGITESITTMALSVAPNPSATGRFRLEGLPNKPVSYVVFDAQGRRIRVGQLTAATPEVNLAAEPAGLYLLRGEVSGKAFTRRLIR